MKADLILMISPEAPLMKQLGTVLGKLCTPYDGDYEYTGTVDKDGEIWVCLGLSDEEEYYSNLDDGYITHWKPMDKSV